jgi:hypothetical protein
MHKLALCVYIKSARVASELMQFFFALLQLGNVQFAVELEHLVFRAALVSLHYYFQSQC